MTRPDPRRTDPRRPDPRRTDPRRRDPRRSGPALRRLLALWAVVALLVGLGTAAHLSRTFEAEQEAAFRRTEAAADIGEQAVLASHEAVRSVLQMVLLRDRLLAYDDPPGVSQLELYLAEVAREGRFGIRTVSTVDLDGRVTWSTSPDGIGVSIRQREYFRAHFAPDPPPVLLSAPMIGIASQQWRVQISNRILNAFDVPTGLALVSVDPLALSAILARAVPEPGRLIGVRRMADGTLRAVSREAAQRLARPPSPNHPTLLAARTQPRSRLHYETENEGRRIINAYRALDVLPVVVSASFDRDRELAPFHAMQRVALLALALFVLGSLLVTLAWHRNSRLRSQLSAEALQDPLTGLANRRALRAQLEPVLAGAPRRTESLALLLFDLDHFKSVNDRHGHSAGDQVLRDVAEALRAGVRRDDMVCRWGGEEMLVVLRHCAPAQAAGRAEALRLRIQALYADGAGPVPQITASIGVACCATEGATLDALVRSADAALYRAKAAGRNRVELDEEALAPAAAAA